MGSLSDTYDDIGFLPSERGELPPHSDQIRKKGKRPSRKPVGKNRLFLKGPVPWGWIREAERISGTGLFLGLYFWRYHWYALENYGGWIRFSRDRFLEESGKSNRHVTRILKHLEDRGLIEIRAQSGRKREIRILRFKIEDWG